jgi:rhomboid protease GluP
MLTRTESLPHFTKQYPTVCILLLLDIIVFLLSFLPIFPDYTFFKLWAGYNRSIADGEWWRLITSIFLHSSFNHLLYNCFSIVILAPALEKMIGSFRFSLFFIAAGIAANTATYIVNPLSFIHVGSSSAILGVLGFYLYVAVFHKERMPRQMIVTIYVMTALSVIMTCIQPEINLIGHLSGLSAGILLAPLFQKQIKQLW